MLSTSWNAIGRSLQLFIELAALETLGPALPTR